MGKLIATAVKEALKLFSKGPTTKNIEKAAEKVMETAAKATKAAAR
jgi:methionine aminopeptidase